MSEHSMQIHCNLTDAQWDSVEALFARSGKRRDTRGRPSHRFRDVFDGVLWIMITGKAWAELPASYPDFRTCHRRFKEWHEAGVLQQALQQLFGVSGDQMSRAMSGRMRGKSGRRSS